MRRKPPRFTRLPWFVILMSLLVSCGLNQVEPTTTLPSLTATSPPSATLTATPFQPSPTPLPLAARVNGEGITQAELEMEVARFQASLESDGTESPGDVREFVLQDLITNVLLAQAAEQNGFTTERSLVDERYAQLVANAGGEQAMTAWLAANGYEQDSFREALSRAIASAWMRDQIIASVPTEVEQVHARQILLQNSVDAQEALAQLQAGRDFATLAATYDPLTNGDLGWFPRGYLTQPELEQAAFNLEPGQHSEIIETDLGYHIIEVIERDPAHPLDPEARLVLQEQALNQWVEDRREQSDIEILIQ